MTGEPCSGLAMNTTPCYFAESMKGFPGFALVTLISSMFASHTFRSKTVIPPPAAVLAWTVHLYYARFQCSNFCGFCIDARLMRYGRKNGCLLWAVLSIAHCMLIRSKVYNVIVLSRVLAGEFFWSTCNISHEI